MSKETPREGKFELRFACATRKLLGSAVEAARAIFGRFDGRARSSQADRCIFPLSEDDWQAFMAALDAPPKANLRLVRLFQDSTVFVRSHPMDRMRGTATVDMTTDEIMALARGRSIT